MQKKEFFIKSLMTLGIIVGAILFVPSFKIQPKAAFKKADGTTYYIPSYTLVQDGTTGKYVTVTEENDVNVLSFGCLAYGGDTVVIDAADLHKIGEKLVANAAGIKTLDDGIVSANDDYLTNKATYNKAVDEAGKLE